MDLEPALNVEMGSFEDLVRFCNLAGNAAMGISPYIFRYVTDDKVYYFFGHSQGWYNIRSVPMVCHFKTTPDEGELTKNLIRCNFKEGSPKITFVDKAETNEDPMTGSIVHVMIIDIKEIPEIWKVWKLGEE